MRSLQYDLPRRNGAETPEGLSSMPRKLFGTDGIRGLANTYPVTPEVAMKAGMAAGRIFTRGDHLHRVVIGKDTRLSGYMIESALVAGFTSVGMDVFLFGPLPTPAVAMLTRSLRADLGVMISASHNHFEDNGIKFFGPEGLKLSDEREAAIEELMANGMDDGLARPRKIGRAKRIDDAQARYIEYAKRTFPKNLTLDGLRIVIDCAHGAAYKVAPAILWELGADVIAIGDDPNGFNINHECGSTFPEAMQRKVRERRADFGIALDGDADRVVMADEKGNLIDGDQILALIAHSWSKSGNLTGGGVVGTVMSNEGLDRYLRSLDLKLARAAVGDRYVLEKMWAGGFNVGGEQSGHIVLRDFSTTGDGIIAALQVLGVLAEDKRPASEAAHMFDPLPQVLENVRFRKGTPLTDVRVTERIKDCEARLNGSGRLLVRKSGTEPVIRVMAEGDDEKLVRSIVRELVTVIEEVTA
jgi:phosphoglucosamine mutase